MVLPKFCRNASFWIFNRIFICRVIYDPMKVNPYYESFDRSIHSTRNSYFNLGKQAKKLIKKEIPLNYA